MSDLNLTGTVREITLQVVPGGSPQRVKVDGETTYKRLAEAAGLTGRDLFANGKPVADVAAAIGADVTVVIAAQPTKGN